MFSYKSLIVVTGRVWILRVVGFAMVATMPAQSQYPPPVFNPPKSYYLALGDSISYGYQAFKARAGLPPSAFNTGYVDTFAARLREINPAVVTVNYSCPGESSESFVTGPCAWREIGQAS